MLELIEESSPGVSYQPTSQAVIVLPKPLKQIKRIVAFVWPGTTVYFNGNNPKPQTGILAKDWGHPYSFDVSYMKTGDCVIDQHGELEYFKLYNKGRLNGNATETIEIRHVEQTTVNRTPQHTDRANPMGMIRRIMYELEMTKVTIPITASAELS